MNGDVSFNVLLKSCIERLDVKSKKANPDKGKTTEYKQYQQNMRELFNDQSMLRKK